MYQLNIIEKNKERPQKNLTKDIKIFLRKKIRKIKEKKQEYSCDRYKNISEDEKQKLAEYRKNIME